MTKIKYSPIRGWRMYTDSPGSIAGLSGALGDAALTDAAAGDRLAGAHGRAAHLPHAASPAAVQRQVVRQVPEPGGGVTACRVISESKYCTNSNLKVGDAKVGNPKADNLKGGYPRVGNLKVGNPMVSSPLAGDDQRSPSD